jgi:hypothetical protein
MRSLTAFTAVLLAVGCASHPPTPPAPIPPIHRIAFVPPIELHWVTFENAAPPVGSPFQFWVNKIDSHGKAFRFNQAVEPGKLALAEIITEVVTKQLRERGFEVEVLEDVKRPADNPDNIDDEYVASHVDADAVLHIWFDEVGMYSRHLSDKYVPRINIRGKLWTKLREDSLYSDEVDYGADARKGKSWAIFADERYQWGSFDELMSHMEDVRAAYTTGARLAAMKMADQVAASAVSGASLAGNHRYLPLPRSRQVGLVVRLGGL